MVGAGAIGKTAIGKEEVGERQGLIVCILPYTSRALRISVKCVRIHWWDLSKEMISSFHSLYFAISSFPSSLSVPSACQELFCPIRGSEGLRGYFYT